MNKVKTMIIKDLRYNSLFVEIMYLCLSLGYGVMFGLLSRTIGREGFYLFQYLIPFMLSIICASVVVINLSYDQKNRTGEMILTTGISIRQYILAKFLDGIIVSFVGVILFEIMFVSITISKFSIMDSFYPIISYTMFILAANLFYACCGVLFKLRQVKKIIITAVGVLFVPILIGFLYYRLSLSSFSFWSIFRPATLLILGVFIVDWLVVLLGATKCLSINSFLKK